MIVFDLICSNEHVFEAWFKDSAAFERQRRKKAIECPMCGDTKVEKALMAPNIATSEQRENSAKMAAETLRALSAARSYVEDNCEYVGGEFAEEARKIHHGETDKRDIYGEATKDEADSLREEGVEFGEIPWVPRMDN